MNPTPPTYSPDDLAVIDELIALQGTASDGAFCRAELKINASVWNRVRNFDPATGLPKYAALVQDFGKLLAQLRDDATRIKRDRAFRTLMGGRTYEELDSFKIALNALRKIPAGAKEKMVVYLARTNGGKSTLIDQAVLQLKARRTHARESWRRSYKAALLDLLDDLHLMPAEFRRKKLSDRITTDADGQKRRTPRWLKLNPHRRAEHELEAALITGLRAQDVIIAIDDAQIFGARSINLLRTILTETNTKVLIASDPDLYARWQRAAWLESGQLITRTAEVIELPPITPEDTRRFLRAVPLNGDMEAACVKLAEAANRFGLFGFIADTARALAAKEHVALADVEKQISRKALAWHRGPANEPRALAVLKGAK